MSTSREASTNPFIDSDPNDLFIVRQKNIKNFFETENLRKQIKEFFEVQRSFHVKMNNLMQACRDVSGQLSEEQQQSLQTLLAPYGVLVANPFEEVATGDLEVDITHIFGVINERNRHFNKTLPALMLSAANLYDFNKLLAAMRENEKISTIMKETIQTKSWMDVESHVAMPFQNLMRYDLLLTTMRKTLVKAGYAPDEPLLENIMNVIAFIVPELKYINEYRETLVQLNEIDALVVVLAKMEALQRSLTAEDEAVGLEFTDKVNTVRTYISMARTNISKGDVDVLVLLKDLLQLLTFLSKGVLQTLRNEKNSYYVWAYQNISSVVNYSGTFFGNDKLLHVPEKDPREKLMDLIKSLKIQCDQVELIRKMQQAIVSIK